MKSFSVGLTMHIPTQFIRGMRIRATLVAYVGLRVKLLTAQQFP